MIKSHNKSLRFQLISLRISSNIVKDPLFCFLNNIFYSDFNFFNFILKIARTAAEDEVKEIEIRIEDIVQEAKEWVFNNIGRNSQRDQLKAKRLVMRLDHLPIKYSKVIERCRSLEDAELIAERKKQRELEGGEKGERMDKSEKELLKQERKAANAIKKQERLAKKAARIEKHDSHAMELTTRRTDDAEFASLEREYEDYTWIDRKRRQAETGPPKKGGKFRPGRVSRRPEKYFTFLQNQIKDRKLQRNELRCDGELYPECKKRGKAGADARRKFRPNAQEAMWTKIIRAMRLAPLEVKENCHIWDRLEKKTSKLKEKAWQYFLATKSGQERVHRRMIDTTSEFFEYEEY
jgi:hypothetical protein